MNLTKLVREPFTPGAWFDFDKLEEVVPVLVRMLDNVLDLTTWPLPEQRREAQAKRRIGIGITGLGDALIMLGLKYSSVEGREFARRVMERIRDVAYLASVELAKERGAFPLFDADRYPKTLDGLCKLLSIDMRIIDPAWIGMKLRKLTSYKEPQGDFLARVPGSEKQANFTSTAAYVARLLIHRYHQLGLLNEDGTVETKNSFLGSEAGGSDAAVRGSHVIAGKRCPECGVDAVVKYNGCDKCTNCGYVGSCG